MNVANHIVPLSDPPCRHCVGNRLTVEERLELQSQTIENLLDRIEKLEAKALLPATFCEWGEP
jgi:hypothetical protein